MTIIDEREYQRQQLVASKWLAEQPMVELSHKGQLVKVPKEVSDMFLAYTNRAVIVVGDDEQGANLGWEVTKWMVNQPWGIGFWRPEFVKWTYLYVSNDLVEAEKYFWISAEQSGLVMDSVVKKLQSAEMEVLDEWGLDRAGSGT